MFHDVLMNPCENILLQKSLRGEKNRLLFSFTKSQTRIKTIKWSNYPGLLKKFYSNFFPHRLNVEVTVLMNSVKQLQRSSVALAHNLCVCLWPRLNELPIESCQSMKLVKRWTVRIFEVVQYPTPKCLLTLVKFCFYESFFAFSNSGFKKTSRVEFGNDRIALPTNIGMGGPIGGTIVIIMVVDIDIRSVSQNIQTFLEVGN